MITKDQLQAELNRWCYKSPETTEILAFVAELNRQSIPIDDKVEKLYQYLLKEELIEAIL